VTLWLRHDDIASLEHTCPNGNCPPGSNPNELGSIRSRAVAEGPIAAALAASGLAAALVGGYLLLTDASGQRRAVGRVAIVPVLPSDGAGAALFGSF
jgi:hypothetical protein